MRSLTSRPLLATTAAVLGVVWWFLSLDGTCGESGDGGWIRMPWVLVGAAAAAEAWAAVRRGGDALSAVLWALCVGAVLFGGTLIAVLLYAGSAGCFD